ncbi:MAG: glycosyltransferase family 4 protein [Candidatus Vogelbacteria bacterium]|nr:glycosyltransferase family 4 protein [Candidatus Vogelbacteria bacterium]
MRILIITNNLKPNSGWGRYSLGVVNEYQKLNIQCLVLTETTDLKPLISIWSLLTNIWLTRRMADNYDIIHAFDGWPYGVYGYFAVLGTNKKLFINAVGTYAVIPLKRGLLARSYRRAQQVFAISDFIKNKILEQVKLTNISTVYLGLTPLPEVIVDKMTNFPVILTVGEIKNRKGQYDTIQAIKLLTKDYPKILYLIIGSGRDQNYTQKIKDYAVAQGLDGQVKIIVDAKTDQDLAYYYAVADVFTLNSKTSEHYLEGFGLVLLEAAQFGLPVVASRDSGTAEAMQDGYNGYLATAGDSASIAEALTEALKDKERLGANSKLFVQNFTWQKTAQKYLAFYKQL